MSKLIQLCWHFPNNPYFAEFIPKTKPDVRIFQEKTVEFVADFIKDRKSSNLDCASEMQKNLARRLFSVRTYHRVRFITTVTYSKNLITVKSFLPWKEEYMQHVEKAIQKEMSNIEFVQL